MTLDTTCCTQQLKYFPTIISNLDSSPNFPEFTSLLIKGYLNIWKRRKSYCRTHYGSNVNSIVGGVEAFIRHRLRLSRRLDNKGTTHIQSKNELWYLLPPGPPPTTATFRFAGTADGIFYTYMLATGILNNEKLNLNTKYKRIDRKEKYLWCREHLKGVTLGLLPIISCNCVIRIPPQAHTHHHKIVDNIRGEIGNELDKQPKLLANIYFGV